MNKNILFISPTGTLDNGAEISITNLMNYLVSRGHNVYNVFPNVDLMKQKEYIEFCISNNIKYFSLDILKWWWSDAPGGMPGTQGQLDVMYKKNIHEIRRIISDNKIDLVITNTVNMFQGAVAASCENIPHIWLIHEFPFGEFGYYREKIPFIDAFSSEVFAVSGALTKDLQDRLLNRKVKSFSPFTEITESELIDAQDHRIVCVGRLTERKNQLELLKAYAQLENNEQKELVFIGGWDEKYKNKCDKFIEENHLDRVRFVGNVENPWSLLTNKDICVLPAAMETFGLVYVEAVLNNVPVIFSDNPGHLSAFQLSHAGKLYRLNNITELKEGISYLLSHFDYEKSCAIKSAEKMHEKYQIGNVYQDLVDSIESNNIVSNQSLQSIASLFENSNPSEMKHISNVYYRKFLRLKNWFNRIK